MLSCFLNRTAIETYQKIKSRSLFILLILFLYPRFVVSQEVKSSRIEYKNPRVYTLDISFEITPDPSRIDRENDLKVWMPVPREWESQKSIQVLSVQPEPHSRYTDPEYGNEIYYWDFGKFPEQSSYRVDMKVRLISYSVQTYIDTSDIKPYDKENEEYKLYTRSGHIIHITPKVEELASEAVGSETNPYLMAQRIVAFVHQKIRYNQGMIDRSLDWLLEHPLTDERTGQEYYSGACTEFAALFVAMCRSQGIPARCVYARMGWGPYFNESNSDTFSPLDTMIAENGLAGAQHHGLGAHMWAEFYLQDIGWIPADANAGIFGWPHHYKMIMIKGRDRMLGPEAPVEINQGYGFQWVPIHNGKAEGLLSAIHNIGKISKARSNVYHSLEPFPADAIQDYKDNYYSANSEEDRVDRRKGMLGQIDYITRDIENRTTDFSQIFKDPSWVRSLQYQYDAMVCHMLNQIMGEEKFGQLIKEYESLIVNATAPVETDRFIKLAEEIYGSSLEWFFDQWEKSNGLPHLKLENVSVEEIWKGWRVKGDLIQTVPSFSLVPVELSVETEDSTEFFMIWLTGRTTRFEYETKNQPLALTADPNHDLLKLQNMPLQLSRIWDSYPEMILIYGTTSEQEANKAAAERFNNEYLGLDPGIIRPDTSVTEEDLLTECVVLFGRPETNRIGQKFKDLFPISIEKNQFTYNGIDYTGSTQGLAQTTAHPLRPRGQLIQYAGLSAEAMMQFGDLYLYDAPNSYVIYDADRMIISGDWADTDPELVYKIK